MNQAARQAMIDQFVMAAHGNLDTVRVLHAHHPDILHERHSKTLETALDAATHVGNRPIISYLLGAGAPITICTAAVLGDSETVAAMLAEEPTLAQSCGAHNLTALTHAAMGGNVAVADMIYEHGGRDGVNRALQFAVGQGHEAMVRWLLDHGADAVDARNQQGKTLLTVARERGFDGVAQTLAAYGAVAE